MQEILQLLDLLEAEGTEKQEFIHLYFIYMRNLKSIENLLFKK